MIFVGRPFLFRSSQRSSTEVLVSFPSFSSGQCSVNMSNITGPRTYFQRIILPSMICKLVIFFAFGALGHAVSLSRSVSTALFAESLSFSMASSENLRPSSFAALSLFYEIGCIAFKEQLRATLHFFFLANGVMEANQLIKNTVYQALKIELRMGFTS